LFRYSCLCGTASDAVDAVKLEIPQGFKLLKFKMSEYLKIIVKVTISKICNAQLRYNFIQEGTPKVPGRGFGERRDPSSIQ